MSIAENQFEFLKGRLEKARRQFLFNFRMPKEAVRAT